VGDVEVYTQTNRPMAITTPLGKDVLLLRGFSGVESISKMFHFDLDLASETDSVKFQDIVGKNVTLRIYDPKARSVTGTGSLAGFRRGPAMSGRSAIALKMVPWLWFLTRTADCRIFQNKTVPDIIKKISATFKFQDFELRLYGDFPPRDYCVQYRETDFNFVSRLMEEEGIYYYFTHEDKKHVMIWRTTLLPIRRARARKPSGTISAAAPVAMKTWLRNGSYHEEFRPGAWAQTDYNFETPSTSLAVSVNGKNPYEILRVSGANTACARR